MFSLSLLDFVIDDGFGSFENTLVGENCQDSSKEGHDRIKPDIGPCIAIRGAALKGCYK
jgi:hypothetical protein